MPLTPDQLPDDIAELKERLIARTAELAAAKNGLVITQLTIEKLKAQIARLRREKFGASSERIERVLEQLELALEEAETAKAEAVAAQTPQPEAEAANAEAFAKVKVDKEREATQGHDGTWVAHPGLVPVALEAFDRLMPAPNQIATKRRDDVHVTAADLLTFEPETPISEKGLRLNINVAVQYVGAWLIGQGAVPIYNLMEDAATAEISRSQVWQWIRSPKGTLDDGRKITKQMVAMMIPEEVQKIRDLLGAAFGVGKYDDAATIFADLVNNDTFVEFLTLPAYERID